EGLAGGVVGEAVLGADLRLARELRGRRLVGVGRRVVAVEGTDLELHALVEEEVAVRPELRRKERLQAGDLVDRDDVAFLEGRRRGRGVLRRGGGKREAETESGEGGKLRGAQAHGGSLVRRRRASGPEPGSDGACVGRRERRRYTTPRTVFI